MLGQIKLYSFTAPLFLLSLTDIGLEDIWDYMRGLEFRTFLAEITTQVFAGVADAFITAAVQSFFAAGAV